LKVSPKAVSSRREVKIIGRDAVPIAESPPLTVNSWPFPNFRTAPGTIVKVAPVATVISPAKT